MSCLQKRPQCPQAEDTASRTCEFFRATVRTIPRRPGRLYQKYVRRAQMVFAVYGRQT